MFSFFCDHEHSLIDSFVNNNKSNRWNAQLVIRILENLLELRDLFFNNFISHSFSNTVSVNDDLVWKLIVSSLVAIKSLLHGLIKLLLNNFFTLALQDDVRIVLSKKIVSGSCEPNNRLSTSMADVNSNYHHLIFSHELRHSHLDRGSSDLCVDLLHDV